MWRNSFGRSSTLKLLACALAALILLPQITFAQTDEASEEEAEEQPQIAIESAESTYLPDLIRLAEISGSMQYLRTLCGEAEEGWRDAIAGIVGTTGATEEIGSRVTAAYNRGYRRYAPFHKNCTASSVDAAERFRVEGRILAKSLVERFGN